MPEYGLPSFRNQRRNLAAKTGAKPLNLRRLTANPGNNIKQCLPTNIFYHTKNILSTIRKNIPGYFAKINVGPAAVLDKAVQISYNQAV